MTKSLVAALAATFLLSTAAFAQDTGASTGLSLTSSAPDASGPIDLTLNGPSSENEDGASSAAPTSDVLSSYTRVDTDRLGSKIIGSPVYSSAGDDADNFGNINDIVFDANGQIVAVVIGVGGFLGLGEKQVAVDYSALQWTVAADNTERYVLQTTKDALTSAPDFQTVDDEPDQSSASDDAATDSSMMDTSTTSAPVVDSSVDASLTSSSSLMGSSIASSAPMDTMSSTSSMVDATTSMGSSAVPSVQGMASSGMDATTSMGSSAMGGMSTTTSAPPTMSSAQ